MTATAERLPRVAFVTIGQAPRTDVVPQMLADLGLPVAAEEFGILDGLDANAIAALAPAGDEYRFASRLRDGSQAVMGKPVAEAMLARLMASLDDGRFDALVPLCTGTALPAMRTLVIEPQQVVDHLTVALARGCKRLGIVLPLEGQVGSFHLIEPVTCELRVTHASPYTDTNTGTGRFAQAGETLRGCDLVVMHCMGYTEAMRAEVARHAGAPVLLSNRMVATLLGQVLHGRNRHGL
ncbi:AroM family protein [Cupriavidus consociatus]|uniref:AroM family protein n=1 Tax=Cupriavidus consociatus TaxID=2821357 RepID=UPI001AEAA22B|nr:MULTISPECIES: AroM family protein [unclassified Cupriavidus]MBP0618497.1 AroM family protein [Cupriavidus sp. LEh25]MDK2655132.1 AroM family protein [Cupriavidus sp. LEh21]